MFFRICWVMLLQVFLQYAADAAIDDRGLPETRGVGMGGADSAAVEGSAAVAANPAALGFMGRSCDNADADNGLYSRQAFGWNVLDAGLNATLTGDLGDYLQTLANLDFDRFESSELRKPGNLKSLIRLADTFGNISDQDTIILNAGAGSLFQIGHFGTGFRMYGQIGGWINDLDLVNLGLQLAAVGIVTELEEAINADGDFDPVGYQFQTFNPENVDKLRTALGAAYVDDDVIAYLDHKTTELVGDQELRRDQINAAVDTLADIIEASDLGTKLSDNTTSITGRGFIAAEIPISFGYALNDHFSVGVAVRAIFARVYGTQIWAFNDENADILKESLDSSVDRFNVGLDASMIFRIPNWQFAFTGYNLNSPDFDGYTQDFMINGRNMQVKVPGVTLDPQLTLGAAWQPAKWLVLGSDIELLETGTLLNHYNVQRVSFGTEFNLSLVQLRLGTYKNIAESDIGWVLTGGLGVQLWGLSADLGAAVSINDTVQYDGVDYPRTARLHLGVSVDL